ncbi:MAG: OmpA family protein [Paludibacteraceae bacterium]|nr:OmpA family protein [Paludibacteraceae bacterium]
MKRAILILWMTLTPIMAVTAQEAKVDSTAVEETIVEETAPQYFLDHHLNFNLGGGLHTMISDPLYGHWEKGFGGMFEARYELVPKVVGFGTGLKLTLRNSATTSNYKEDNSKYVSTAEGKWNGNGQEAKSYTSEFKDWHEKENMMAIEIPAQFVISTGFTKPCSFHAAIGASLSLPIAGKYKPTDGYYNNAILFEQTDYFMDKLKDHDDVGEHMADDVEKGKIKYGLGVNAIADLGMLKKLTNECALYFGLYGSYGVLNVCKKNESNLYNAQEHKYVGLYSSNQVSKITPIEAGVKIGVYLSFHDTQREINEVNKIQDERVRSEAEAAAAKRAAKTEDKGSKAEPANDKNKTKPQENKNTEQQTSAADESLRKEAIAALREIKNAAKYANVNASPLFPKEADEHFLTVRKYLEANPEAKIIITGHTDNSGTPAKNIVNGQHRAEAFKNALVRKNIPRNRIGCVSKGETEPIASNDTPEGREQNRRVELDLVDSGASSTNDTSIEEDSEEELRIGGE